MIKKIAFLGISAILLGGCTLTDAFKAGNAAQDEKPAVIATSTPTPIPTSTPDAELQTIPSPGSGTDDKSLETDINNTIILEEDFSDLN